MNIKPGFKILFVFICLLGLIKGNCLNYGHSCWGAHGKRSALPSIGTTVPRRTLPGKFGLFQVILDNDERYNKYFPEALLDYKSDSVAAAAVQSSDESLMTHDNDDVTRKTIFKNRRPLSKTIQRIYDASTIENNDSNENNMMNRDNSRLLKIFNEDIQG